MELSSRELSGEGAPPELDENGWPKGLAPGAVKGFLDAAEGGALHRAALAGAGACLEVGSYCGKSTIYLGTGCRLRGGVLYALDHHAGSEEHQPGEAYHDPALYDARAGRMDSFPEFRRNVRAAGLEQVVVPLVAPSALVARHWSMPLGLVFIDGAHSEAAAFADYRGWAPQLRVGGVLAIHDIFLDPDEGGQAPHAIYRAALASGLFEAEGMVGTLGFLRRRL